MTPQLYVELSTNLEVAAFEEWLGREWARMWYAPEPAVYPVPPETWIGPPAEPPPEAYNWYYSHAVAMAPTGGVYVLDDDVMAFATAAQTLSNGQSYSYDLANEAKTWEQLSAAAQAVLGS